MLLLVGRYAPLADGKSPSNRSGNKSSVNLGRTLKSLKFSRPFNVYTHTRRSNVADNNNMFVVASPISLISSFKSIFVSRVKWIRPYTLLREPTIHTRRENYSFRTTKKISVGDDDDIIVLILINNSIMSSV